MSKIIILVGPPGSCKSTFAKNMASGSFYTYVNQDSQGKEGHLVKFKNALLEKSDIVIDRMGFSKEQRSRYLEPAKQLGYESEIIVFHENWQTCFDRIMKREGHETIKDEKGARSALQTFFLKYERPTENEADKVTFLYPEGDKSLAIYSDIDGTIANCDHRRHFVRREDGKKKDWIGFFKAMSEDTVNIPVMDILHKFDNTHKIIYCSGRPDDYRKQTEEWLEHQKAPIGPLFMRHRHDSRSDDIVKEILLDFEIKTRYNIFFCLDDRDQVVKMLRRRGLTVLQVAEGDF